VKLQLLRYVIPLKKSGMRYTVKRILLEVFTTLKSIFNENKLPPPQLQVLEKASLYMKFVSCTFCCVLFMEICWLWFFKFKIKKSHKKDKKRILYLFWLNMKQKICTYLKKIYIFDQNTRVSISVLTLSEKV